GAAAPAAPGRGAGCACRPCPGAEPGARPALPGRPQHRPQGGPPGRGRAVRDGAGGGAGAGQPHPGPARGGGPGGGGARGGAVEADPRLLPALAEVLGDDPGVRVEVADALRVDLAALAPEATRMVANLPYGIAATLVLKALAEAPAIAHQVGMGQREVGERLAAAPGSAAYGAPSAKLAAQASARVLAPVSRRVFVPEPHVDSWLLGGD